MPINQYNFDSRVLLLLLLEVLWFVLFYSEHYTRVSIIRTWSRFCRIIYLLMNSECILIWLGTHSERHGRNVHSLCRSTFSNGLAKTQQLGSSCNAGNNDSMIIAPAAEMMMHIFYMSLFARLCSRLSQTLASRFQNLVAQQRYSARHS